ncbi:hypothetical protein [Pedobacter sandarakinus]|uniref:hypothetical protein n=1 Tax=Pedobacter sandarakinus TaxID=353156 RepID=UPI0022486021|nr:hypothetical protein [Pedobacter sandarakinus]MCX2574842.1 hypothetical protein [Pedobacter sandarakinus]
MKLSSIFLFAATTMVFACQSSKNGQHKADSIASIESGPGKIVDPTFLIVPGRSIGEISLGDSIEKVAKVLGKADGGDAAMGKAWGIWYGSKMENGDTDEIAIYSSYKDTTMHVKDVKQIRITSPKYKTQDGFTVGRTTSETKNKFPGMALASSYLTATKDTVQIYDAKQEGIAFEFLRGKGVALTIHPPNQSVNNTYLTLHPDWKILE